MEISDGDNDGSNIFWPGYVDATTNLVLNLLFLLTIMIVAVFMFALELGRTDRDVAARPPIAAEEKMAAGAEQKNDYEKDNISLQLEIGSLRKQLAELPAPEEDKKYLKKAVADSDKENTDLQRKLKILRKDLELLVVTKQEKEFLAKAVADSDKENSDLKRKLKNLQKNLELLDDTKQEKEFLAKAIADSDKENTALKREIKRLNHMLTQGDTPKEHAGDLPKSVEATSDVPKAQYGLDEAVANDFEIIVSFKDDAVGLTPTERDRLLETLKLVVESEETNIYVEVPAGFSEAKRMGFYRALAVRNLLIEMKMPKENINVSVVEGASDADASVVKVRLNR